MKVKKMFLPIVFLGFYNVVCFSSLCAQAAAGKIVAQDLEHLFSVAERVLDIVNEGPAALSKAVLHSHFLTSDVIVSDESLNQGLLFLLGYKGEGALKDSFAGCKVNLLLDKSNYGALDDFVTKSLDPSWQDAFYKSIKIKPQQPSALETRGKNALLAFNVYATPNYEFAAKLLMLCEDYVQAAQVLKALQPKIGPAIEALKAAQATDQSEAVMQARQTIIEYQLSTKVLESFFVYLNALLFRAAKTQSIVSVGGALSALDSIMQAWAASFGFGGVDFARGVDQYFARVKKMFGYPVSKALSDSGSLVSSTMMIPSNVSGIDMQDATVSIMLHAIMFHQELDKQTDGSLGALSPAIKAFLIDDLSVVLKDLQDAAYLSKVKRFLDPFFGELSLGSDEQEKLFQAVATGIMQKQKELHRPMPDLLDKHVFMFEVPYKGTYESFVAPALGKDVFSSFASTLSRSNYYDDSLELLNQDKDGLLYGFGYGAAGDMRTPFTSTPVVSFFRNGSQIAIPALAKDFFKAHEISMNETLFSKLSMLMVGILLNKFDAGYYFVELNRLFYRLSQNSDFTSFAQEFSKININLQNFWGRFGIVSYSQYTTNSVFDYYFNRFKTALNLPLEKQFSARTLVDDSRYSPKNRDLSGKDAQDATVALLIRVIAMHEVTGRGGRLEESLRLMLVSELAYTLKDLTSSVYLQDDPNQTTYLIHVFKFIIPFLQPLGITYKDILNDVISKQAQVGPQSPTYEDFQAFDLAEMSPSFS